MFLLFVSQLHPSRTKLLSIPAACVHLEIVIWDVYSGRVHRKRVFETVKNVNQTVRRRSVTPTGGNIPGSNQSLSSRTSPMSSGLSSPHSGLCGGDLGGDGVPLDNRAQSILMETASNQER